LSSISYPSEASCLAAVKLAWMCWTSWVRSAYLASRFMYLFTSLSCKKKSDWSGSSISLLSSLTKSATEEVGFYETCLIVAMRYAIFEIWVMELCDCNVFI
jgi:hypothetical protein